MHPPRIPGRRRAAVAAAALVAVLAGSAPGVAQATPGPDTAARAEVAPAVLDAVANGQESAFFVVLKEHAEAFGEPRLLGSVLSVQREQARRKGRLRKALEIGSRALALAEHAGDPAGIAFERANLAELHLLLDEHEEASARAAAAVRESAAEPYWSTPYALHAAARVAMHAGDGDPDGLLDRALCAAVEHGDHQARREVLAAQAERHTRQGDPEQALALLEQVRAAGAAHLLARAHLAAGHARQAAELALAEAERAARAGEHLVETEARIVHAAALAALGHRQESTDGFAAATRLATELPYPAGLRYAESAESRCRSR
ncbi:hypothetical protein [Streptomyces vietnamensis]|uniref:hypothetical protein n=1 Tax=Streptomyces vietnamensis TaxID=362257 RepID=UPI00343C1865